MKTRIAVVVFVLVALALVPARVQAQSPVATGIPAPRTITVTATSELEVVPDQALVTVSLSTYDKELPAGKARHDERAKALQDVAAKQGMQPADIQSGRINIWTERSDRGKPRNVHLSSTMIFRLRDLSRYDELLSGFLNAGVESIQSSEFTMSDRAKYKAQARLMAVRSAREQAEAMAQALGQRLGPPLLVAEGTPEALTPQQSPYERGLSGLTNLNGNITESVMKMRQGDVTQTEAIAPGQIVFKMTVTIRFELQQ